MNKIVKQIDRKLNNSNMIQLNYKNINNKYNRNIIKILEICINKLKMFKV